MWQMDKLDSEDLGNWILLADAGRKLKVPFIASGGVGTGSQLAAALVGRLNACVALNNWK